MTARRLALILFFVAVGFVANIVLTDRIRSAGTQAPADQPGAEPSASGVPPQAIGGLPDLSAVAQRAVGSVPNISSTQLVRRRASPFGDDPMLRFFFGDQDMWRERREQSLGSGVVVSADGYVLTNNHVVLGGQAQVTVILPDKRELAAEIVGVDEATDLAVLKIAARNLPTIPWGDSSKLRVAEWVLAIGNPFGVLNQTVTLGIVSATGRSLGLAQYEDFIQTDAAINRGNSGGALINARGELIGINTAIFSETGGYQGVGFAVPSNLVRHVMRELIEHGAVRRGTIADIELVPMTTYIAEQLGVTDARGLLVRRVLESSGAYAAGLRPGDIIISFNGTVIEDASQFIRLLSDAQIGSTATLGVTTDGKQRTVKVPIVQASGGRGQRRGR
jgi:Do/DeqQ family serine protease